MNWHYEKNGTPVGPVTETQLDAARVRGEIRPETRVWCEGWPGWRTAGDVWPSTSSGSGASPPPIPTQRCAECGVPHSELVTVGGMPVCPACKPRALDKLRQGVPLGSSGSFAGPWRDGALLVAGRSGPLPDCCLKCGAPQVKQIRRTLAWHEPAYYLIIFAGLVIYLIVALIVRKTAKLTVPLCARCNARRVRNIVIGWLLFLLSVGMFFASSQADDEDTTVMLALTGGGLLLAMLIWAVAVQLILAKKITHRFVWIGKAGKDVVASLPPFPGE